MKARVWLKAALTHAWRCCFKGQMWMTFILLKQKKMHKQNWISKLPHLVRIWRLVSYYLLCLSLQYLTYEDCLKKVYEAAEHCRAQSDETQLSVSFNDICDGYQEKLKRLCLAHSAKGLYWLSKKLVWHASKVTVCSNDAGHSLKTPK